MLRIEGKQIGYHRGDDEVQLVAVRGQSIREEAPATGDATVETETEDWIVLAERLCVGNTQLTPQRGDYVVTPDGETFDVTSGQNAKTHSWMDTTRSLIRIHTVKRDS